LAGFGEVQQRVIRVGSDGRVDWTAVEPRMLKLQRAQFPFENLEAFCLGRAHKRGIRFWSSVDRAKFEEEIAGEFLKGLCSSVLLDLPEQVPCPARRGFECPARVCTSCSAICFQDLD
jgi:hypothetical protein